jgi:uncharacterized membrane protein YkvA (DUF1232 family)
MRFGCFRPPMWLISCNVLMVLLVGVGRPAAALQKIGGLTSPAAVFGTFSAAASSTGGLDARLHKVMTRAERSANRLVAVAGQVGLLWLWILGSAALCLLIAAFASVADMRMFDLRRDGPGVLARYVAHGMRTFFRILRDRRTPYLARFVLLAALLYWLLPSDIIADDSVLPGFLDDIVIVVLAAKVFMYLCPDSLVARHATAVEAKA